jgi:SAM-dependent methyltransferase
VIKLDKEDQLVTEWYKRHADPTELPYKLLDWKIAYPYIRNKDVLNVGCAYPIDEIVLGLYAKSWVAIDFVPEVIQRNTLEFKYIHMNKVKMLCMDCRELKLEPQSFDVVLDFSSGDHVCRGRELMRKEVYRVLRKGGLYIVMYPNRNYPGYENSDSCDKFGYEHHFTPEEIRAELEVAGFRITDTDVTNVRSLIIGVKD